ncbi:sporulation protein YpjB [Bacillus methanolicus]|uniref:sporulation protein YpjB n=1 Tax=Bacillus methanolicus TaxID=1471 RepID=UPI002380B297|nr:sporulation protein YpjB [Bacillus methanolicus]MDE3839386.1 sporulation protein YpjB [Bacillus methanolicus]
MRAIAAITMLTFFLLAPFTVIAEHTPPIDKLDEISDEALQMVKLQRYDDAKKILEYFSKQFLTFTIKEKSFSMDELRIVTVAHKDALEASVSAAMTHEERINRVTKFRLVVDAVTSTHQPLWAEMEGPIMSAFNSVKESVYNGDNEHFHSNLNSFLSLYEVIYPSMRLDIPSERMEKVDARVKFIDQYRPQVLTQASSQQELEALQLDLQNIFDEMNEDEADPSLWWVMISTGSIIILTLSYVGWRKYRGDREKERNRSRELKD